MIEPLSDFGVLGYGEIRIQKSWSGNRITAEGPWMTSTWNHCVRATSRSRWRAIEGARNGKGCIGRSGAVWNGWCAARRCAVEWFANNCVTEILGRTSSAAHVLEQIRPNGQGDAWSGANGQRWVDRKSTRLNSSHTVISYAVFCLKKKKIQ